MAHTFASLPPAAELAKYSTRVALQQTLKTEGEGEEDVLLKLGTSLAAHREER